MKSKIILIFVAGLLIAEQQIQAIQVPEKIKQYRDFGWLAFVGILSFVIYSKNTQIDTLTNSKKKYKELSETQSKQLQNTIQEKCNFEAKAHSYSVKQEVINEKTMYTLSNDERGLDPSFFNKCINKTKNQGNAQHNQSVNLFNLIKATDSRV